MLLNFLFRLLSHIWLTGLHASPAGAFPPPLSAQKEQELLNRLQQGDPAARDKLVEHNLRLVAHIVKKYYSASGDPDDLISIGTIGLIKGVTTFNPSKGSKLTTYAARCIENEILMHFRSLKKTEKDVYMTDPIDTDKEGNTLTLADTLSDETDMVDTIDTKMKLERLKRVASRTLTEREQTILAYRFGLNDQPELTQHEIAARLGISRSYVSRIEKAALKKLRCQLTEIHPLDKSRTL